MARGPVPERERENAAAPRITSRGRLLRCRTNSEAIAAVGSTSCAGRRPERRPHRVASHGRLPGEAPTADGTSGWKAALWSGRSLKGKALVILAAVVLAVAAIGALGDNDDNGDSSDDASATTEAATTGATATDEETDAAEECVPVPADVVAALEEGFNTPGTSLRNAYAVKSDDLANAWYISGDLEGPGLDGDDEIATWAKGGDLVVGGGLLLASNEVAKEFSDWGTDAQPGSPAADAASMNNHGAQESQECVRDA